MFAKWHYPICLEGGERYYKWHMHESEYIHIIPKSQIINMHFSTFWSMIKRYRKWPEFSKWHLPDLRARSYHWQVHESEDIHSINWITESQFVPFLFMIQRRQRKWVYPSDIYPFRAKSGVITDKIFTHPIYLWISNPHWLLNLPITDLWTMKVTRVPPPCPTYVSLRL